ncbi:VOC family protein [Roseimicrobium sp. ORNL1]|uniref:VOC family protein n=1 Tax=Roseimicrobium sp. ORNL1 TaxID=2711231 RepID=UPI0013E1A4DB|nr:VOC family protein [Roseimicrobium sp. ORNL1]QIF04459.1 VOC family protein [Roseimicrobium sp. ORNL1]
MLKVSEIAFSCYPVTDMARACAFYEGVLGLKKTMDHDMGESGHWVEFDIGPATLGLGKYAGFTPTKDGCTVGLEVEDFDAAVKALQDASVPFTMGPMETPVCHMLFVSDPEGNPLIIHKRKPGHS